MFVPRRLPLLAAALIWSLTVRADELTIDRLFSAPDLSGPTLHAPQISPDGARVTYLRGKATNKDQLDLWSYDITRQRHHLLVDSAQLLEAPQALSAEEEQRRERQRISSLSGIVEYRFSHDARRLLVPLGGDLFVYDLNAPADRAVRRITTSQSYETDARFSPRGRYVSFIRDQNLFIYDLDTGTERAITRGGGGLVSFGMAEFIAQEEMDRHTGYWWSPDETQIAFTRADETPVEEVERFEIYADNVKVVKQRYPFTGARNARVELFVAPVAGAPGEAAPARAMDLGADPDVYLARVDWFPDCRSLAVQRHSRDQKTLTLLKIEAASGAARELLTERSTTWVPLHQELTFLEKSPRFIWASQRSGFKHLYLYDLDGRLLRPLTAGEWMVVGEGSGRAIRAVDEARGRVYFMANAETPLERHLYSVPLDAAARPVDGSAQRITQPSGWHAIVMADNARVYLDTFSTPEQPPRVSLHAADGRRLATLIENKLAADHPYAPYRSAHLPVEFGTLEAADGQTLHYQLIRPRDISPNTPAGGASAPPARYPVIVDVYGGPGVQRVRRAWGNLFHQILAQNGYIVLTVDGRGSGLRGERFEAALYRRMGTVEVEDQMRGVEFLRTLPEVDPQRIGVFGWSYGGYMALLCLIKAPEHFAAAVSGAPVTDWHLYDTHYTERYMGTPQENPEGYAAGNVNTHAPALRGPLLIIHGMADDNVLFTHSTALFKTLQTLSKPFSVMPYPGSKHALLRHADTGPHAYHTIKNFFDANL